MELSTDLLIAAIAARPENKPILLSDDTQLNASELLAAIDDCAKALHGTHTLALLGDNTIEWVIADLAALFHRIPLLPLPTFFTSAQIIHALDKAGVDTVLTDQPQRILELNAGFGLFERQDRLFLLRRTVAHVALPPGTAKISFTSGSTGDPKGVCLSTDGFIDTARSLTERLRDLSIERHLAVLPFSLLLENVAGIYAPLLSGAEIHVRTLEHLGWKGMHGFSPQYLQESVIRHSRSTMILVPELLKAWALFLETTEQSAPGSLRYVAVGGSRIEYSLLTRARDYGIPAYQGYGLTECGSVVSLNRPGDDSDGVGRPLPHVDVKVNDGEIDIQSRAFLGYVGDTKHARDSIFSSGDLGYFDEEEHLHLSGRKKNLLISSYGRNISPEWIESILLDQPEFSQAVVFGEGQSALSAVIVPRTDLSIDRISDAVSRVNQRLPDYAQIKYWLKASPFTLENGQATGNNRPIRPAIFTHYACELEAFYLRKEQHHVVL